MSPLRTALNTDAVESASTPVSAPSRPRREAASRFLPRALLAPAVITPFLWMIVPLLMTIYFSLIRYNLMQPGETGFFGLANYEFFVTDPSFWTAIVTAELRRRRLARADQQHREPADRGHCASAVDE